MTPNRSNESGGAVPERWIMRYTKCERFLHWMHSAAFLMLTVTGMVFLIPSLQPLIQGDAGLILRLVHRVAAAFFVLVPLVYLVCQPRRLWATLCDVRFGRDDIGWLKAAPGYYLVGRHEAMPPQGRFNSGEKLNVIFMVAGTLLFALSGLVMWFGRGIVPAGLVNAMVVVHVLAMVLTVNMFLVHFYLAVAHPLMWQSLNGMRFGVVSESYARHHHVAWYASEMQSAKSQDGRKATNSADLE